MPSLAEGASRSLNKTIRELRAILAGRGISVGRGQLRPKVYRLIEDLAEEWYRVGFSRGVKALSAKDRNVVKRLLPVSKSVRVWLLGRRTGRARRVRLTYP